MPYLFDVRPLSAIRSDALLEHIARAGVRIHPAGEAAPGDDRPRSCGNRDS